MPELPEVETVRLAISKVVNKALIEKVDIFNKEFCISSNKGPS